MKINAVALRALCLVSLTLFYQAAQANPTGGSVVGGNANATITGQGSSLVTIYQNGQRVIIDWNTFSIGLGELTKFIQPSDTASILNRVLSANPSLIYGSLQANGRVFLVNPAGILVGPSGVVDTRSFLASTLDIGNDAFRAAGNLTFAGSSTASVRNEGTIRALGGDVFLVANTVGNSGTIQASGTVGLAAGSQILLTQAGVERISVQAGNALQDGQGTGVENLGRIQAATAELKAAGGNIYALAINNGGSVRATTSVEAGGRIYLRAAGADIQNSGTLSASSIHGNGGTVVVDGGHNAADPATVINSGTIEATGSTGRGGSVEFLGDYVGLFDHGRIDVSGATGGGTTLIGGDFHGENPAVHNALRTEVDPGASIRADALTSGNGGRVIVWSDEGTRFFGTLSARGGARGGSGGFAEVSGQQALEFRGSVNMGAPHGIPGTLLLDPDFVNVVSGGTNLPPVHFADAGTTNLVDPGSLDSANATVVLQAREDVTFLDAVNMTNVGVGLVAQAGRNVTVSNTITTAGGFVHLEADSPHSPTNAADGVGTLTIASTIDTTGGGSVLPGANVTLIGSGFNITADVNAGSAGNIDVALARNGAAFSLGAATGSVLSSNGINHLLTTGGTLTLGRATTAGDDGLGSGAVTLTVSNLAVRGITGGARNITLVSDGVIHDEGNGAVAVSTTGLLTLNAAGAIDDNSTGGNNDGFTINAPRLTLFAGNNFTITDTAELTDLGIITRGTALSQSLTSPNRHYSVSENGTNTTLTRVTSDDATALNFKYQNTVGGLSVSNIDTGGGNLTLNSAGAITQAAGGKVSVSGLTDLIAGNGTNDITLANANNELFLVTASGRNIRLNDADTAANDLILSNVTAVNLTASSGGNIGEASGSGLVISGLTDVSAGAGKDILLSNPNNELNWVKATGSTVQLTEADTTHNGLTLTNTVATVLSVSTPGNLTITNATVKLDANLSAGTNITLSAVNVTNNLTLTATNGDSSLNSVFVGADLTDTAGRNSSLNSVLVRGSGFLTNAGTLAINSVNVGTDLIVQSGGTVSQTGALVVSNNLEVVTTGNGVDVLLGNSTNFIGQSFLVTNGAGWVRSLALGNAAPGSFTNAVFPLVLTNLTLNFANSAITLGGLTISSNLSVLAGGDITQSNAISVGALATFLATNHDITIADPNNELNLVSAVGHNVSLYDADTARNNLSLTNVIATTLTASGAGSVSVRNSTISQDASLFAATNLTLGGVNVANNLSAIATNGSIIGVGAVAVGALASLDATNGNVTLSDPLNDFNQVQLASQNATLADANGINLGASAIANGLSITAGGAIIQSGTLNVGGLASFTSTGAGPAGNITLNDPANSFGSVSLSSANGQAVSLTDAGQTSLDTIAVNNGSLTINSAGVIIQVLGTINVGGLASFNSTGLGLLGNIILGGAGNNFGSLSINSANGLSVSINENSGTALDDIVVNTGSFTLNSAGAISQVTGKSITVGGLASFNSAGGGALGNITLTNTGNNFGSLGLGSANGLAVTVVEASDTALDTVTINNGSLSLTSAGAITQTPLRSVTVGGLASFTSTGSGAAGNILLLNSGNNFGSLGLNSVGGSLVAVNEASAMALDTVVVGPGTLALTSLGDISQVGSQTITVGGAASFTAPGGNSILLGNLGNSFSGPVSFLSSGGGNLLNVSVSDALSIALQPLTVNGGLTVASGGTITQLGALSVGGLASFKSAGSGLAGNITLTDLGNNFGSLGLVSAGGLSVVVNEASATALDTVTVTSGTLSLTSGGDITQVPGRSIDVGNAATFITGAGNSILLDNPGNTFNGTLSFQTTGGGNLQNVSVFDTVAISLLPLAINGNLTVISGGAITEGGALNVGGLASFTSTGLGLNGDITLGNLGNNFGSLSLNSANGLTVSVTDAGATVLDTVAVNGVLNLISAGNISQVAGRTVIVGGTSTFNSSGNITLANAGNDFGGLATIINGLAVSLVDVNGLTVAGSSVSLDAHATGGDLTLAGYTAGGSLAAQASGNILQTGSLFVGTTTSLNAGGNVTLADPGNDFGGLVTVLNGQTVNLVDVNSLNIGGTSQSLSARANGGNLTFAGYSTTASLTAQASASILEGGPVVVGTTASLNAGANITLANPANDFVGLVTVINGQTVSLVDANGLNVGGASQTLDAHANGGDLTLAGYITTGSLAAQASGNILEGGPVVVGTTTSLNAGGNITLANPANDFAGLVTVVNGQTVSLVDANSLNVGGTSQSLDAHAHAGDLTLAGYTTTAGLVAQASGNILETGPVVVGTTANLNAGGNIALANGANDFVGLVTVVNGQAVNLVDANSLNVGGASQSLDARANGGNLTLAGYTTGGSLAAQASGNILETAPVVVGTTASLNAGGNISLANAGNDFVGLVTVVNGQTVSLVDANALTVAGTSQSLDARANGGDLTLAGYTTAASLAAQASGNIVQSAAVIVGTTANLNAGGNITLANPGNDFVGLVTIANGQAVSLVDANSLNVGGASQSLDAHANGGDLTLAGYTTASTLAAQASGNILESGPVVVGTTASLNAGGNITLANAANDFVGLVTVVNGAAVSLVDANSLNVGGSSQSLDAHAHGGDLTLAGYTTTASLAAQATGNILQSGALVVGTTASLNAGANITLADAGNDFVGLVTALNGQAVSLVDANSLDVGGASQSLDARANGGNLTLAGYTTAASLAAQASGSIGESGPVVVGTTASLNAGGNITLANAANDFVGLVTVVNGQAVSLVDANSLNVGGASQSLDAHANGGNLTFAGYTTVGSLAGQASGNILESGPVVAGTTASLNAGGNITLANGANDFVGLVTVVNGQAVSLVDANSLNVGGASQSLDAHANGGDLTLAGYTTAGSLAGQASGNILESGPVVVGTTASLNAGGNITLANAANDFVGLVTVVNGQAVSLVDGNSLSVGGASQSLDAHANGGDLTLAGYTTSGSLAGQASGNILEGGPVVVGTTASLNAGGNITLANAANDFVGLVTVVNGQAVSLVDANSLTVGGASQSLDAHANGGNLTFAGYITVGSLAGRATGNILQTAQVAVGTTANLSAGGTITLSDVANDFAGLVTVASGGAATLVDANSLSVAGSSPSLSARANGGNLTLAGYTTTGALVARASGSILESARVVVGSTANLTAGGSITFGNAANDFVGLVTIGGGQAVTLVDENSLNVGGVSQSLNAHANGGNLTLAGYRTSGSFAGQASGSLLETGPLVIGTTANLNAGGAISLNNAANDFGGLVTVTSGGAASLVDANNLSIDGSSASLVARANSGDLTLAGYVTPGTLTATAAQAGRAIHVTGNVSASGATLTADNIGIQANLEAGTNGTVVLQPISSSENLWISGQFTNSGVNYSGLNNVRAGTLQVGNTNTFTGNIIVAQSINLTSRSTPPYRPTPVSTSTNDATTLSLQTKSGTITNAFVNGSWAVITVPRLSMVASNASILGSLNNSSDVSFLAWRSGNPIHFVDVNTLDLLWVDTANIGNNVTPQDDPYNQGGFYFGIDSVFGPHPVAGNDILFNGGGLPAQQFANSLAPFNSVELPMTKLTLSSVTADIDAQEYAKRIRQLLGSGSIFRSFAQIPFPKQVPYEDLVKPEAASKWVRGYLGISGSTGAPQQPAF